MNNSENNPERSMRGLSPALQTTQPTLIKETGAMTTIKVKLTHAIPPELLVVSTIRIQGMNVSYPNYTARYRKWESVSTMCSRFRVWVVLLGKVS